MLLQLVILRQKAGRVPLILFNIEVMTQSLLIATAEEDLHSLSSHFEWQHTGLVQIDRWRIDFSGYDLFLPIGRENNFNNEASRNLDLFVHWVNQEFKPRNLENVLDQ